VIAGPVHAGAVLIHDRIDPIAVTIVAVVVVLALLGMLAGWRRRGRVQSGLALPQGTVVGEPQLTVRGLLLATTFADRPLDRVVAEGLGHRVQATVTVAADGVRIDRHGAHPLTLPAAALTGAGTATWTVDRSVEPGGLTVLGWNLLRDGEPVPVESAFRLSTDDRDALVAAVRALVPGAAHAES
jgi:hypothetical protein